MTNRRFEMYEYRQVIVRMRLGESDRAIAQTGLMGRKKSNQYVTWPVAVAGLTRVATAR